MARIILTAFLGTTLLVGCSKGGGSSTPDANGGAGTDTSAAGGASGSGGSSGSGGGAGGLAPVPVHLPLTAPPTRAATAAGFLALETSLMLSGNGLSLTDPSDITGTAIGSRFYSAGPTNLLNILANIDGFISGINTQSTQKDLACLQTAPVEYTVNVFGETQTFYAQCNSVGTPTASDPQLRQFGVNDGILYVYEAYGAERVAAIVTPNATTPGKYQVHAWIGVGYNSGINGGSYGVFEMLADSAVGSFEMSVAGVGFGYCGIQLKSDGSSVYATGSNDMGSTCTATNDVCVLGSDLVTAGACTNLMTFELPALGRKAVATTSPSAASPYPATPNITLDGTSTDSLWFGPTVPTAGSVSLNEVATGTATGTDTEAATSTGTGTGTGA